MEGRRGEEVVKSGRGCSVATAQPPTLLTLFIIQPFPPSLPRPRQQQAKVLQDFEKAFKHPLEGWASGIPKDQQQR